MPSTRPSKTAMVDEDQCWYEPYHNLTYTNVDPTDEDIKIFYQSRSASRSRTYRDPGGNDSTDALITERGKTHGDYTDYASVAQKLKYVVRNAPNWARASTVHKQGIEAICDKLSRALCGDHDYAEHFNDIAGYARLVAERCSK